MESAGIKIIGSNKKAYYDYHVDDTMECGISLQGTEVKSIKDNRFSFSDSYARIRDNELWIIGLHVSEYPFGNVFNHEPDRDRKLLVHSQELKWLRRRVDEKGFTLIPLKFYLKRGMVKLEIGICKGKKSYDKRESIKARDMKREVEREFRGRV
jgi:SsrA-binding protein